MNCYYNKNKNQIVLTGRAGRGRFKVKQDGLIYQVYRWMEELDKRNKILHNFYMYNNQREVV